MTTRVRTTEGPLQNCATCWWCPRPNTERNTHSHTHSPILLPSGMSGKVRLRAWFWFASSRCGFFSRLARKVHICYLNRDHWNSWKENFGNVSLDGVYMAAVKIYNIMRKTCNLIFWGLCRGKHLQLTIFSHDNSSSLGLDGLYHFRLYQSFKKSPV